MAEIIFWQSAISPHMIGLAEAMVHRGHQVSYTLTPRSEKLRRSEIGWPEIRESRCTLKPIMNRDGANELAASTPIDAHHIFQGLRGRPLLEAGLKAVLQRGSRAWCLMECIDERSITWPLKRALYRHLLTQHSSRGTFFLAIGRGMPEWLVARGAAPDRVFPFAYFLTPHGDSISRFVNARPRIAFVGRLIKLKRLDLLIRALSSLPMETYELTVIGDGPCARTYRDLATALLPKENQHWIGVQPMSAVRHLMTGFDCVILPSDYDGWGAVISESLIAGTPVICSDRCGAAAAIYSPDMGAVFRHGDLSDLRRRVAAAVEAGPVDPERRLRVRNLARVLTTVDGAEYLDSLIAAASQGKCFPVAPWLRG